MKKVKQISYYIIIICLVYISITIIINAFVNPELTSTQLLLSVPDSILWKFK